MLVRVHDADDKYPLSSLRGRKNRVATACPRLDFGSIYWFLVAHTSRSETSFEPSEIARGKLVEESGAGESLAKTFCLFPRNVST